MHVRTIGCSKKGWRRELYVDETVRERQMRDPNFERLLEQKLDDHGRTMPKVVSTRTPHMTMVWGQQTRIRLRGIVITTECMPDGVLRTRVGYYVSAPGGA